MSQGGEKKSNLIIRQIENMKYILVVGVSMPLGVLIRHTARKREICVPRMVQNLFFLLMG